LFEDLLYHSNYDVIFENIHLDSDEIGEQIDKRISKLESL